jgi:hypothetical protein
VNKVIYFHDEVEVRDALNEEGSDREEFKQPELVPHAIRNTMEELAYRTALWYDPQGKPVMAYHMTLDGVQPRAINDEDYSRNDEVGTVTLSGEEPRLPGQ